MHNSGLGSLHSEHHRLVRVASHICHCCRWLCKMVTNFVDTLFTLPLRPLLIIYFPFTFLAIERTILLFGPCLICWLLYSYSTESTRSWLMPHAGDDNGSCRCRSPPASLSTRATGFLLTSSSPSISASRGVLLL